MSIKIIRIFICSAGIILMITALAKLASSVGSARILERSEPILHISFRHIFWLAGTLELAVAIACLFGRQFRFQAVLLAWLATIFVLYRLGLLFLNYSKPCPCLGNLTDALHISPQTADVAMKIILAYLLIGSYISLFWFWRQQRKNNQPAHLTHQTP